MITKIFVPLISGLILVSQTFAEDLPSSARAYRAHLLTFIWPEESSSEKIDYEPIYDISNIERYTEQTAKADSNAGFSFGIGMGAPKIDNPFEDYEKQIGKKVTVLSNQTWPMIFNDQGSVIEESFHSKQLHDGYPVLTGHLKVKLGRYLETEVDYKHFLFDTYSVPSILDEKSQILDNVSDDFISTDEDGNIVANVSTSKLYRPTSELKVKEEIKTASKKLNYLDHPIVGSLLYYEPITLAEAEQEIMLAEIQNEDEGQEN